MLYCTYQFNSFQHTNLHFNITSILISHGFSKETHRANIYINLYEALKSAIMDRTLDGGFKLPPSRVLAKDLKISRSTILKAYDLLVLEKYVNSIVGSGYFINSAKVKKLHHNLSTHLHLGNYPKISKKGNAFRKNIHLINKRATSGIAFRPGLPPLDIFPIQVWKQLTNDYWKTVKSSELSYSNTIGIESLRHNIANYLKIYRNIVCDQEQIVITTGSLHSLSLISDALIDSGDAVVIENPTYPYAFKLFQSLKASIQVAKIDDEGMVVEGLRCKNPKIIYTTPSNQYPTGVKMSLKRRLELIKWASNKNALIIEDDYDQEFSNWDSPISSIFSLDKQDRTIYLGTFNKLLHPSIRIGYMIVPKYLLDTVKALYQLSSRFVATSIQKTLSNFIEKDYLNKHLRSLIEATNERKYVFLNSFITNFEDDVQIDSKNTGLHIIGHLKNDVNDTLLSEFFRRKNIIVHPFSNYFIKGKKQNGIVMGYSSVNTKVIRETVIKMKSEYSEFLGVKSV